MSHSISIYSQVRPRGALTVSYANQPGGVEVTPSMQGQVIRHNDVLPVFEVQFETLAALVLVPAGSLHELDHEGKIKA